MQTNRSIPNVVVIPELGYADLRRAVPWLCAAFGFAERLRIGDHRVQLIVGDSGAIVARDIAPAAATAASAASPGAGAPAQSDHSLMVRVADVDAHCEHARAHGATIVSPPTTYPYGERQYAAIDIGGHSWTFSQTVADVAPETWGGVLVSNDASPQAPPAPSDQQPPEPDLDWTFEL